MGNIIQAGFCGNIVTTATGLWQYDYGQILQFTGLDLPQVYEVHFANDGQRESVTMLGNADGVEIPDALLRTGKTVIAWVYLHTGTEDGETEYKVVMPVTMRAKPTNQEPAPVQQDIITQAIAELNAAVEQTGEDRAATTASAAAAAASEANAAESAANAALSEANAAASEAHAAQSEAAAASSEASAAASEDAAEHWADVAGQCAANAGYMWFYIDENGNLIYQRSDNTEVDFYLSDGDLYVRAV